MSGSMTQEKVPEFNAADIGALAHLYRGELYRSTVWRTRLDATTNWAVVTTGIALSATFSSATASPLPLVLVGLLVAVFLCIETRRYRFFDFWRIRAHVLEVQFFGPILRGKGVRVDNGWNENSLSGLSGAEPAHHFPGGGRPTAAAELWMDIWDPGNSLHRQAADPPRTCSHAQRPVGACRHWAHSGPDRAPRGPRLPWCLDSYRDHDADQAKGWRACATTTLSNGCITRAGKRRKLSLVRVLSSCLSIGEASRPRQNEYRRTAQGQIRLCDPRATSVGKAPGSGHPRPSRSFYAAGRTFCAGCSGGSL